MAYYKCRICLKCKVLQDLKILKYESDHDTLPTIYDMLLFCAPQLLHALSKNDLICVTCLLKLIDCVEFLEQCLVSANQIKDEQLSVSFQGTEEENKDYITFDVENNKIADSDQDVLPSMTYVISDAEELDIKSDAVKVIVYQDDPEVDENDATDLRCTETCDIDDEDVNTDKTPSILRGILSGQNNDQNSKENKRCENRRDGNDSNKCKKSSNKKSVNSKHSREQSRSKKVYGKHTICTGCGKKVYNTKPHACKFICKKCANKFVSKDELEKHIVDNMGEEECKVACSHCSLLITAKEFEEHMRTHPTIMCEICSKCFTSGASLKAHQLVHREKTEKCPECEWMFKTKGALRAHQNYVHKKKEKAILCDMCPKKFHTNSKLKIHKRVHHYQIKQGTCAKCGKSFADKKSVEYHDRLVHQKIKPFCCDICGTAFGRKDYMQYHTKRCNQSRSEVSRGRRRKQYKSIKPVSDSPPRKKPLLRKLVSGQPAECLYCHKVLRNVTNLKLHIKSVHTKAPRKYKCEVCGLQFAAKANLKKHELIHKDPDCRYRCDVCYKKYKSAEELQEHVSQKHKKKPYKCEVCGEKFARRFILENHKYDVHPGAPDLKTGEEKTREIMEEAIRHLELIEVEQADGTEAKFNFCVPPDLVSS